MRCMVCGRTEDDYQTVIKTMVDKIKSVISVKNDEISKINTEYKMRLDEYIIENNYTEEVKKSYNNIDDSIKNITLSAVLENEEYFIKVEKILKPLLRYYHDADYNHKQLKTINDVITLYNTEPNAEKIAKIKEPFSNIIETIKAKIASLESAIDTLYKSDISFHSDKIYFNEFLQTRNSGLDEIYCKYCQDEYTKDYNLCLCPSCYNLLVKKIQKDIMNKSNELHELIEVVDKKIEKTNEYIKQNETQWSYYDPY